MNDRGHEGCASTAGETLSASPADSVRKSDVEGKSDLHGLNKIVRSMGGLDQNAPPVRACLALGRRPGRHTDGRAHLPSSAERGVEIHSQALDDHEVGGQL